MATIQEEINLKTILAMIAVLLITELVQANTITVCPDGCDNTSIQAAEYAAKPGDTIEVHSGTYNEGVVLTKNINFKGVDTGNGEPVVNGGLYKNNYKSSLKGFSFMEIVSGGLPWSYKMVNQNTTLYLIENATEVSYKSPAKALPMINKIINTNPDDAWAWFRKGYILNQAQRYEDSNDAYNESIKIDPYNWVSWEYIGDNFYQLEEYNESIPFYERANELQESATLWNTIGNMFYRTGNYSEALNAYEKAIGLSPSTGVYWSNKGGALKGLGQTTEADAAYAKAKELGYTG